MTQDRSKKTLRHFQCRDYLWELFEQMSRELECSPDYLVNEAMRQYARSRNYVTGSTFKPRAERSSSESISTRWRASTEASMLPTASDPFETEAQVATDPPAQHHVPLGGGAALGSSALGGGRPLRSTNLPPTANQPALHQPSLRLSSLPPALRSAGQPPPLQPPASDRPTLLVFYEGRSYTVDKDEFLIGRGARSADLPIKDGNISRRHAAVVFQDGEYHIRDLGSTNGIEFRGNRIGSKRIDDGDVFFLCDHELRFAYG